MTLILKKIELVNIRSHRSISFEPSSTGITAISGANGAGKSTLVDAIAWALYAAKPEGTPNTAALIKKGTDLSQERCYARLHLRLDHSDVIVERRIMNQKGHMECDIWEQKDGSEKKEHVAGSASTSAIAWVRSHLKMDLKSFQAAVLVQQKQVDQLINAGARDRAQVIENLTGISSVTKAIDAARKEYNELKKDIQRVSLEEGLVEKLEEESTTLQKTKKEQEEQRQEEEKKLQQQRSEAKNLHATLEEEEKRATASQDTRDQLNTVQAELQASIREQKRLVQLKDAKKAALSEYSGRTDFADLDKRLQGLQRQLREKDRLIERYTISLENLKKQLQTYEEAVEKSSIKELGAAEQGYQKAQQQKLSWEKKLAQVEKDIAGHQADQRKLAAAIKVISSQQGCCPTCLQVVEEPQVAVAALQRESEEHETAIQQGRQEVALISGKLDRQQEVLEKFSLLVDALSQVDEQRSAVEETTKQRDNELAVVEALTREIKSVEKLHAQAKRVEDVKQEYDLLLAEAIKASDRTEDLNRQEAKLNKKLQQLGKADPAKITSLRNKVRKASEALDLTMSRFSVAREQVSVLSERERYVEERLRQAKKDVKNYKSLLKNVETAGTTLEVLEEFREERIRNSIPVVNTYASDLLSRFTEGSFPEIHLDENFHATVKSSTGEEYRVGMLSGGELSAAALALRLAISMLLNFGDAENMLVLDEVLVSQDKNRVEQILTTIKDVCEGQVIIISHGPNTNEIADTVVEL